MLTPCHLYSDCCVEKSATEITTLIAEEEFCDECSPFFNCSDCMKHFVDEKIKLIPAEQYRDEYFQEKASNNIYVYWFSFRPNFYRDICSDRWENN